MKKYILTESQVSLILKELNESNDKPKNFDDFLSNADAEVSSAMASRANKNTDDAMKNYLGHHYQYRYFLDNDDLVELNKLTTIVFSLLFYLQKEGVIKSVKIPKIGVDLGSNYDYLKKNQSDKLTNLKPLLSNRFRLEVNIDDSFKDEKYAKIVSTNKSIEAIVERDTKKVKSITYSFLDGVSLDTFYKLIAKGDNLKALIDAIQFSVKPDVSGKKLIFNFN